MEKFFYPKSICIVGASTKEKSIGFEILRSIKNYGYFGKLYPVNPNADEVLGFPCFSSISNIGEKIDLAIIVVPKKFVLDSIVQISQKGVKAIILITAGFRETGQEGKKQEEEILKILRSNSIRMIGPNCMGIINTLESIKLNATFVAEKPLMGGIGFLSQSGALGASVLNSLRETDIRFAQFVSIGNKADISELDVLQFWLFDHNIKTIAFYLESIEQGIEIVKNYKACGSTKPLIILKAGKTELGMRAASSHTGAMSSNEKILDALFNQFGIIRVDTINEMFNTAKGYEHFPMPKGNRIAIVTNAGGPAILAVDKLEERNLKLGEIYADTKGKLIEIVHPEGSLNNPIDLLPGATPESYKKVIEMILEDENIDALISIFVEPVMVNAFEVIESVNSINSQKPVYQVCLPRPEFWSEYMTLSKSRKPIFKNPEDPAELISNLLHYKNKKDTEYDFSSSKSIISDFGNETGFLDQRQVSEVCLKYEIPIVKQNLFTPEELRAVKNLHFPLVVKGISQNAVHKSEINAVKLNINEITELNTAIEDIESSFIRKNISLEGFLIQSYIKTKHELLIGGYRDPSFGPIVIFGSGGKYVEILDDTQIRSAYLAENDLDEMIAGTKIGGIIKGVRGEKGVDISKLKAIILSVASLLIENDTLSEIDLNPLVVDVENKFHAVDVRIKLKNIYQVK